MGKRSDFERKPRDFYPTPREAVYPLLPHLAFGTSFVEPCAGDGALVRHLESAGHHCGLAFDVEPRAPFIYTGDALDYLVINPGMFITNPPWTRDILHPLIVRLSDQAPTWLLFDADWVHTRQAVPYLNRLRRVVSVGRVKWIADSPFTGKDNCAWHLFDKPSDQPTLFFGRGASLRVAA